MPLAARSLSSGHRSEMSATERGTNWAVWLNVDGGYGMVGTVRGVMESVEETFAEHLTNRIAILCLKRHLNLGNCLFSLN